MKTRNIVLGTIVLTVLLILSMGIGMSFGSTTIPFSHTYSLVAYHLPFGDRLIHPSWSVTEETILVQIRLPRVLLGLLVGASLALAGVAFQGVLRNPLADPYILGVSAGASVGAAMVIALGISSAGAVIYAVPLASFVGAIVSILVVFGLGSVGRRLRTDTLILAGVVTNSFFGAMLTFALTMVPGNQAQQIVLWLLGSLSLRDLSFGWAMLPFFFVGFVTISTLSRELNTLSMGERGAASLGVHVERIHWILLISASLLTALSVSVAGVIGFVGLVIPHMVRYVTGPDHRVLIPFATVAGGIFLVLSDVVARSLVPPLELSIGVVTAMIGAPFFAWQLYRLKKVNA